MAGYVFDRYPVVVDKIETKFRSIKTKIPCPGTKSILERLDQLESRSMHGQLPLVWNKALDYSVFDSKGNKWIDFTSSIFIANVGHSNPRVSAVIDKL